MAAEGCRSFRRGDLRPAHVHGSTQIAIPGSQVDMLALHGSRLEVMLMLRRRAALHWHAPRYRRGRH